MKGHIAGMAVVLLTIASAPVQAALVYTENFNSGDGGYIVVNSGPISATNGWVYDGSSTWSANGEDNLGTPSDSRLNSPLINVNTTAPLTLTFDHRYSFESGLLDGGAVFLSVNGGPYTQVPTSAFTENGYTGIGLIGNHDLINSDGFNGDSPGYAAGDLITSTASLGSFGIGDTLSIQFLGAWNEFAKGTEPNWQIDSIAITSPDALPEPASFFLLALGGAGLLLAWWKRGARA
jgi:hypothetical protein